MGVLTAVRAVVSGGASGLGRATVERLVKSGGRVVIMDLPSSPGKKNLRAGGGSAARAPRHNKRNTDIFYGILSYGLLCRPYIAIAGADLAAKLGPNVVFSPTDVTNELQVNAALDLLEKSFGYR